MRLIKTILLWAVVMLGTTFLAACGEAPQAGGAGSYQVMSVTELNEGLKHKDFVLVNVHIPFEGNIAGTDLSIPYDTIGQNLNQLPADKTARIVLYCRSGRMSKIAAETLSGLGYTHVWDVSGGMIAWEAAGLPLEGR